MIAVPRLNGLLKTNSDVLHEILEVQSFEHNADRNIAINQMGLDDVQVKQQLEQQLNQMGLDDVQVKQQWTWIRF
ncbi:unnamed protein product [Caenorhabditis nigoni]